MYLLPTELLILPSAVSKFRNYHYNVSFILLIFILCTAAVIISLYIAANDKVILEEYEKENILINFQVLFQCFHHLGLRKITIMIVSIVGLRAQRGM